MEKNINNLGSYSNKKDFFEKSNLNQLSSVNREYKDINKKPVKRVDYHKVIFEHTSSHLFHYEKSMVTAEFHGVKYQETTIKDLDMRFVLNEAIEKYINYAPIQGSALDTERFVAFINKTFHINVLSIDAVDLSVTKPMKQENDVQVEMEM